MAPDTKEKPFVCFCGRGFARNDLLKRHKQKSHISAQPQLGEAAPTSGSAAHSDTRTSTVRNPLGDGEPVHREDGTASLSPIPDFVAFMDSIGLAPDWNFLDFSTADAVAPQRPLNTAPSPSAGIYSTVESHSAAHLNTSTSQRPMTPATAQMPHPYQISDSVESDLETAATESWSGLWKLSESQWSAIADEVALSQESLQGFVLPSQLAMSRYLQSYSSHFHKRYPIIHIPTYQTRGSPCWRTLAVAAIGAQYQREQKNGHMLYEAAKSLTLRQRATDTGSAQLPAEHRTAMIQTLVLLMAYGAWDEDIELLSGALDLQTTLHDYIRGSLSDVPSTDYNISQWDSWVSAESHRRAILIAYAYLVVQCTAYDLPPVVLTHEIHDVHLPGSDSAWEAQTEREWQAAMLQSDQTPVRCIDALRVLTGSTTNNRNTNLRFSSTASFVMLQALLQRIFFVRQIHSISSAALPSVELRSLQCVQSVLKPFTFIS